MKYSVSSLGYVDGNLSQMKLLDSSLGIEIFVEWTPDGFFENELPRILRGRKGEFSLHAPFNGVDLSAPGEDDATLQPLLAPLALCRRFDVKGYVAHTNGPFAQTLPENDAARRRQRVARRLEILRQAATEAGTVLLVENLGFGGDKKHLYDQAQFLQLFSENPNLSCIIDVGHALVAGYDILALQQALGSRIKAYHLHDNLGLLDSHLRLGQGLLDIARLMHGVRTHTPQAAMIFEYAEALPPQAYLDDMQKLEKYAE